MNELIEALQILAKYLEPRSSAWHWPTNCSHDRLEVMVSADAVTNEQDRIRLGQLGFFADQDLDVWTSNRFGSA